MGYTKGTQWTIEKIQEYLDEQDADCKVLSKKFIKVSENMLFQCKCGNHFERTWNNMKRQKSYVCLDCSRNVENKKKSNDITTVKLEFAKYGFTLLNEDEYVNNTSNLSTIDSNGYKYYCNYANFRYNHTAQRFHKSNIYTIENIHHYLKSNDVDLILLDDKYVNATTKMIFTCSKGHKNELSWNAITSGCRCKECYRLEVTKSDLDFKKELYELYGDEYICLETYITNKDKILFKHKKCGKTFPKRPFEILLGGGCPHCKKSKGEDKCESWLLDNHFIYEKEYKFDDLLSPNGYNLRFDFAVLKDNEVQSLIEYDGEFHYRNILEKGKLEKQQLYDSIKDTYIKEHNIKLIRIPYWEYKNIDKILEKALLN